MARDPLTLAAILLDAVVFDDGAHAGEVGVRSWEKLAAAAHLAADLKTGASLPAAPGDEDFGAKLDDLLTAKALYEQTRETASAPFAEDLPTAQRQQAVTAARARVEEAHREALARAMAADAMYGDALREAEASRAPAPRDAMSDVRDDLLAAVEKWQAEAIREKERADRCEALLATWRRNRASPMYGSGSPGPLYAAGMAAEADSMIAGLDAALSGGPHVPE